MKKSGQAILLACMIMSLATVSSAQASPEYGKITGRIVDAESGQSVSGASVALLEDISFMGTTDLDGRYSFDGIVAGDYTVRIFKQGYEPIDVSGVNVLPGESTRLDVPLPRREVPVEQSRPASDDPELLPDIFELPTLMVTATAIQDSNAILLENRQRSSSIGNAIGSTAFSRLGLDDAAEAMTKVTGASVVDGKYVFIRGLGDRYSNTLLNGATLPSADPDKRAVQMDQFPSDLLDSIVTSKSFTPDQPGSFSGGSVNVKTKSFPDQYFLSIGVSGSYNSQTTGEDILVTLEGVNWRADGIDDRPRTQVAQDYIPRATGRDPSTATGAALVGDLSVAQRLDEITREFTRHFYPVRETAVPSHGLNFSIGDTIQFKNDQKIGYTLSLTWDRDYAYYEDGIETRWASPNEFKDSSQVYTTDPEVLGRLTWYNEYWGRLGDPYDGDVPFGVTKSTQSVNWGAFGKVAYLPGPNHELALTLFHNQSADDEVKRGIGDGFNSSLSGDSLFEAVSVQYTERGVSSAQLGGKHLLESLHDLKVDWQASMNESTQDQPDYRTLFTAWDYEQQQYRNVNASDLDPPIRRYRAMVEDNEEYTLDFTLPVFKDSSIKWGGLASDSSRNYSEITYNIQPPTWQGQPDPQLIRDIYTDAYIGYDFDKVEAFDFDNDGTVDRYNIIPAAAGRHVIVRGSEGNNYVADGAVSAVYLMGDFSFGEKWRMITGARWESNEMNVLQLLEQQGVENRSGGFSEEDFLPAMSFVYQVNEDQNIRLAYGRTIAKPSFKELSPVVIDDSFTGDRFQGNPDLNRSVIDNLDLRWEWFLQDLELVAISAFYKKMDDPIEVLFFGGRDVNGDGSIDNRDQQPFQRGNIVPQNVPEATIYGIEMEVRYSLSRLSEALSGFSVGGNVSIIESEVDVPADEQLFFGSSPSRQLVGQSPFLVNIGLAYDNDERGTYLNLSYNYTDERLSLVNPNNTGLGNVFEAGIGRLSLTYTQRINGSMKMKIGVSNLLDPDFRKFYAVEDGENIVYESYRKGLTMSISFTYTFE